MSELYGFTYAPTISGNDNGKSEDTYGNAVSVGKRVGEGYSIQARLWGNYEDGQTVYGASETEFVHVKAGFFNKLVWFFKHLFNPGA